MGVCGFVEGGFLACSRSDQDYALIVSTLFAISQLSKRSFSQAHVELSISLTLSVCYAMPWVPEAVNVLTAKLLWSEGGLRPPQAPTDT